MEEMDQHKKLLSEYVDIIHDHSKHPAVEEKNVLKSLEFLDKYPVTEETLKESRLGLIVSRLVHQERSELVSEMAKQLQLKWVQQVTQQGDSTPNLKRERKESPCENGQEKSTKRVALDGGDGVPESSLSSSGDLPKLSQVHFRGTLADPHRNTNQIRLFEALFTNADENKTNGNEESFKQLAIELEQKLFEEFYNKEDPHEYPQHFRSLYVNLKDPLNEPLRQQLLKKNISPAQLVRKSCEELANPHLKEVREEFAQKHNGGVYLHEVSPGVISTGEQGVLLGDKNITCNGCGSDKVSYIPDGSVGLTDRVLVCCSVCGRHWKL